MSQHIQRWFNDEIRLVCPSCTAAYYFSKGHTCQPKPSQIELFIKSMEQSMKTKLERINERLIELRDQAHDDELSDEIDNAVLHVEAAIDRIVQMEEEEEEEEDSI